MEDYGDWIWDESEYNFFMSLGDIAKLEYMYDYFNLDDDEIVDFELDFDDEEEGGPSATSIDVVITDTHFLITCSNKEILKKTIGMFKMDGYIIVPDKVRGDTHYYKYVGMSSPFSVN